MENKCQPQVAMPENPYGTAHHPVTQNISQKSSKPSHQVCPPKMIMVDSRKECIDMLINVDNILFCTPEKLTKLTMKPVTDEKKRIVVKSKN